MSSSFNACDKDVQYWLGFRVVGESCLIMCVFIFKLCYINYFVVVCLSYFIIIFVVCSCQCHTRVFFPFRGHISAGAVLTQLLIKQGI